VRGRVGGENLLGIPASPEYQASLGEVLARPPLPAPLQELCAGGVEATGRETGRWRGLTGREAIRVGDALTSGSSTEGSGL
jgi:hypothetical protein